MKFVDAFESFVRNEVNIDQTRLDRLQTSVDAIESFVGEQPPFADALIDLIPSGSWAYRTIIRPVQPTDEFDADVLLYLNEQPGWLPKQYLEQLLATFRRSSRYSSKAELMTRCVRIDYAGDFHVDVVPFLDVRGAKVITNRAEPPATGSFEPSNPEGMMAWIDERQRLTQGSFVKVVRLAKYLRDYKDTFTCVSIILTTLLGNQVNEGEASTKPTQYADLPSAFVTLMTKLADSLPMTMPAVLDPAGTGDNFTERYRAEWGYDNFRTRIRSYAALAKQAYDEPNRARALALWQQIFGKDFTLTAPTKAALAPLSATVPWSGEQFIDKPPFNKTISISPVYKARISGRCVGGPARRKAGFHEYDLSKHGYRVAKHRSLDFMVTTTVPQPYTLYWKVRNGGSEASAVSQLRGEITQDAGKNAKTETTLYKGTHYVECYVVKNGSVVAKDRQAVIVTS